MYTMIFWTDQIHQNQSIQEKSQKLGTYCYKIKAKKEQSKGRNKKSRKDLWLAVASVFSLTKVLITPWGNNNNAQMRSSKTEVWKYDIEFYLTSPLYHSQGFCN